MAISQPERVFVLKELRPADHTQEREMTMNEWTVYGGMRFVITGGASMPEQARYSSRSGKDVA